jgi:hypothetical protein
VSMSRSVVYVHGLFNERDDTLGDELRRQATQLNLDLHVPRWRAGDFRWVAAQEGVRVLGDLITDKPIRGGLKVLLRLPQAARDSWEKACASRPEASNRLRSLSDQLRGSGKEYAMIGYSKGCQVVLNSLQRLPYPPEKVVFVGAAVRRNAFDAIPQHLRCTACPRIVNVFSPKDLVLKHLYRLVQDSGDAAGLRPVERDWVRNVEESVGHRDYHLRANKILSFCLDDDDHFPERTQEETEARSKHHLDQKPLLGD